MDKHMSYWSAAFGSLLVVVILVSLALVGIFGSSCFADFVNGEAAPAWLQAIASFVAIGAGFHYVLLQNSHQRALEKEKAEELTLRQLRAVEAVCVQVSEARNWAAWGAGTDLDAVELAVDEGLSAFKSIPFADIPDESLLVACGAVRKDLVTLLIHCRAVKEKGTWDGSDSDLARLGEQLDLHLSTVRERVKAVAAEAGRMKNRKIVPPTPKHDAAITRAAVSDADAQPLTDQQLAAMVRMPDIKTAPRRRQGPEGGEQQS